MKGFKTFPGPPEEMNLDKTFRDIQSRERGFGPRTPGMPASSRAQMITAGMTLAPILSIATTKGLVNAASFFKQLFGVYGEDLQESALQQIDGFTKGEKVDSVGLIEAYQNMPEVMTPILQGFQRDVVDPVTLGGQLMSQAESQDVTESLESAMMFRIRELRASGMTDPDKLMEALSSEFSNSRPELYGIDIRGLVDAQLGSSDIASSYASVGSARTDATNPIGSSPELNAYIQKALDQKNLDAKADLVRGLKMGQREQFEQRIENTPDTMLAGIQSRRQALFMRSPAKLPSQMVDDGLVRVPYYSRLVQQ